MKQFYSYLWLRANDTPYYAGKGSENRAYKNGGRPCNRPKDRARIVVFPMENEALAFESEQALIELFGRIDNSTGILHNLTDGGEGPSLSEETKRKLSEAMKGDKGHWFGKHLSEETRNKMSEAKRGEKHPMFGRPSPNVGKHPSDETRKRMSLAHSGENHSMFGKHHSNETRQKLSKANKGKSWSEARRKAYEQRWGKQT
jgi:hypothetical protein